MEREKPTFDILGRIEQERLARSWSEYALAPSQHGEEEIFSRMLLPSRKSVQASALPSLSSFRRRTQFI